MTRKRPKNQKCSNGNLPVYCHREDRIKACRDCYPCAECLPCSACNRKPCPFAKAVMKELTEDAAQMNVQPILEPTTQAICDAMEAGQNIEAVIKREQAKREAVRRYLQFGA